MGRLSGWIAPVIAPEAARRKMDTTQERGQQSDPRILDRMISGPVRSVAVRLVQVSSSCSEVTDAAAAPATLRMPAMYRSAVVNWRNHAKNMRCWIEGHDSIPGA